MTLMKKLKTAQTILKTKGIPGLISTLRLKLDRSFRPDETKIVYDLIKNSSHPGLMIDVGAHHGSSLAPFAELGWQVLAFEPDSNNRAVLEDSFSTWNNVIIDPRACSDQAQSEVSLFVSSESSGVSGLSAFLESHQASEKVSVTTLTDALDEYGFSAKPVDFLKIDTEGFDLMVLKGFPWAQSPHPKVIVCEFEDAKTLPLGYSFHQLAGFLVDRAYRLIISEWYPVKSYGGPHRWRRFSTYPCERVDSQGWGNIIAMKDNEIYRQLCQLCKLDRPQTA
jgi:FkbM family methyltransferase